MYSLGFSIEYLTPAWAAKLKIISNLFFANIFSIAL